MNRMPILNDYKLINIEVENSKSIIYKAYSLEEKKLVLLKTMKQPTPTPHETASSIHEFYITKEMNMNEIIRPVKIESYLNEPILVLEYFSGVTMRDFLKTQRKDILEFLSIAVKLASALINVHQHQIIHKNINPENIILNTSNGKLKITGFNHATKLKKENQNNSLTPYELEGHLAYISPEQTGRMNRSVDYKADLYSLGVLFYEMFTGILPFTSKESIELVHAHLAKTPQNPISLNDNIPESLSNIIMKLLAKIPEERYKSAFGLREDLKKCMDQLRLFGEIEVFQLGQDDPLNVFEIDGKLYGRSVEIEKLKLAFNKVSTGHSELVLIQGHSGIGKTALVNEIQIPLVREKGYFISGKFDLLQRQKPYSPILSAFKSLIRKLLTEGDARIQNWKTAIERELLGSASIITSLIPELKWIVGSDNSQGEEFSVKDTHLRFHLVFQKFVNVFATKDHPLVLFLDDLQWADTASLALIEYLLTHIDCRYFLLIGAYRDNEVGIEHPFTETIHNLEKKKVAISTIPLTPLKESVVCQWVEETIMNDEKEAGKLAELMFRITQGNPFFIKQLFQSFYEDETIFFNANLGKWTIQFDMVMKALEKETIVDLMVKRIEQLPMETQAILKLASCIGNEFDLKTLSIICEEEYDRIGKQLWSALEVGLILPEDLTYKWIYPEGHNHFIDNQPPAYRFLHDRVQQAIHSMMIKEEREKTHLKIGRLLIRFGAGNESLFEIVNHLNIGRMYLNKNESISLVERNVKAGEQAKSSAAFKESLEYYKIAHELLGEAWETNYDLTTRLMTGLGECQYLNSQFDESESTFNKVLERVKTKHEKLKIYNLKVVLYTHVHRVQEAVESGIAGLRLFGWNINRNPNKRFVAKEFLFVKAALWGKSAEDLMKLPELIDQEKRLLLNTMITMNAPSFHVDQNLATILMLRALRFSLKNGITDITSLVVNNYALILSAGFSDYDHSYEFGKLAIELAEGSGDPGLKGRVYFVYGSFINHWKYHIKDNLQYLKWSQNFCIEAGNIHLAGANSSFIAITLFMMGDHLKDVLAGIKNQRIFIDRIGYVISKGFLNELIQWVDILMNEKAKSNWDFEQVLDDDSAKIIHYTLRLQLSYLLNEENFARALINHLDKLVSNRLTLVIISEYYFYDSLWASRLFDKANSSNKKLLYKRLKKNIKKLGKWAKLCPENYLHKWKLLKAELARIDHNHSVARDEYDAAIQLAKENNFVQDVAISNEAAGYYYFSRGLESLAGAYLTEAYRTYIKWGAYAKALKLQKEFDSFIINVEKSSPDIQISHLDFDASLKASQTISSEIIQENLVKKLMGITMRNAGAERGILLLNREKQLTVAAAANVDSEIDEELSFHILEENKVYPEMIIEYVVNSREAVVLNDATVEGMFTGDPYVIAKKPKSILCLPTIYKGNVNSVLYLENNQTTYAFTQERIRFLTFLSTQAAISIENAELYGNLEGKVKERTKEFEKVNKYLERANSELARAEQERRHLLSNISHDLRAPITTVKGYVEAILDGLVETEEQRDAYLRRCIERIDGLNVMINDLFELAQLESGQINFTFDIVPIDQLIKHLCGQYEYDVKSKGFFFNVIIEEINEETYPMVSVDVKRFNQVFSNILINAMNHTETGGISISLRFDKDLGDAFITIEDSGKGILEEDLPYIFDRNFTKSRKGNGLGLAICREIILLHKGRIWAESIHGKGSIFCIQLPVFQVDQLIR